jgi:hypothetical protein
VGFFGARYARPVPLRSWHSRLLRGTNPDDESAEDEEYGRPDPGLEDLREHEAPSLLGGVEPSARDFERPPEA